MKPVDTEVAGPVPLQYLRVSPQAATRLAHAAMEGQDSPALSEKIRSAHGTEIDEAEHNTFIDDSFDDLHFKMSDFGSMSEKNNVVCMR